jgi:hypothetical protein
MVYRIRANWHGGCEGTREITFISEVCMRMDDRTDLYGRHRDRSGFERLASNALEYLRSRNSEHWLMFLAGLMIGLFLG